LSWKRTIDALHASLFSATLAAVTATAAAALWP